MTDRVRAETREVSYKRGEHITPQAGAPSPQMLSLEQTRSPLRAPRAAAGPAGAADKGLGTLVLYAREGNKHKGDPGKYEAENDYVHVFLPQKKNKK